MSVLCALLASSSSVSASDTEYMLSLLPSSLPAAKGGRCLDGSMAGYYYRKGSADTFTIWLEGGGACTDEASCKKRAKGRRGSSTSWPKSTMQYSALSGASLQSADCSVNPAFCNATAVFVPYCTGDVHSGNNTMPTAASWNLIFDGHANFAAILDDLEAKHGLGAAKNVLLSGGSAGGSGTFFNADYLAERLPQAMVKAVPNAGWFFPAALPDDLPDIYPPSDWAHFAKGTHGNPNSVNNRLVAFIYGELWKVRGLLPAACVSDQKTGEWWACTSVHKRYKYIKTPLFVLENQYDKEQIFDQELAPDNPSDAQEYATLVRYIVMYGEAMRNSTAQVLNDAPLYKAPGTDGIFHPSCLSHCLWPKNPHLQGQSWLPIVSDWFWETGQMKQYYRMVEPASDTGEPANPFDQCALPPGPLPPGPGGGCAAQLKKDGCLPSAAAAVGDPVHKCEKCAEAHEADLKAAGCKTKEVEQLCGASLA